MKLIDKLAEIEHRQWVRWATTLIKEEPGLSESRKARWSKLLVPYSELSEEWKEYDREWARHVLREVRLQFEEDHLAYYGNGIVTDEEQE